MFIVNLWKRYGYFLNSNVHRRRYGPIYATIGGTAFFGGAAVEYLMINWRPAGVNFCMNTMIKLRIFFSRSVFHLYSNCHPTFIVICIFR